MLITSGLNKPVRCGAAFLLLDLFAFVAEMVRVSDLFDFVRNAFGLLASFCPGTTKLSRATSDLVALAPSTSK